MGDRGQVLIKDGNHSNVYLYTHSGASELEETIRRALRKKLRWDDSCYLARIIFETMLEESCSKEYGFGICSEKHGDIWKLITIDIDQQKVIVNRPSFEQSFEDYVNKINED